MITISKEEFEQILNVATSSQMQVYEKVEPVINEALSRCEWELLGDVGASALDAAAAAGSRLVATARRYVCMDALLSVLRQLDLVLTPTGFGVVANNTTAPASRERVDALRDELWLSRERSRGELLTLLCSVEGWGTTRQAKRQVRTVFWDIRLLESYANRATTQQEWAEMTTTAALVDTDLRRLLGNAQMDEIMEAVRTGKTETSTPYADVVLLMQAITFLRAWHSPAERERVRRLLETVEYNAETFATYMNSNEYKVNHYERFQNRQDSPGFCFVG